MCEMCKRTPACWVAAADRILEVRHISSVLVYVCDFGSNRSMEVGALASDGARIPTRRLKRSFLN